MDWAHTPRSLRPSDKMISHKVAEACSLCYWATLGNSIKHPNDKRSLRSVQYDLISPGGKSVSISTVCVQLSGISNAVQQCFAHAERINRTKDSDLAFMSVSTLHFLVGRQYQLLQYTSNTSCHPEEGKSILLQNFGTNLGSYMV
jgi:hypothetical protein